MGTAAAVGTDPTASGTVTDTATLGSISDPAAATTGTDPATSATGTDPVALAKVTDTPANEDSNAPQTASGIVSDRAAAGHSASTGAGPDSHDRGEIPLEDAAMGRAAAGHSASTGARPDSHDQPRHSNSVGDRAPSGAPTSTGAATAGDDRNTTTGAEAVPLRTSVECWGAGFRAGTQTPATTGKPTGTPVHSTAQQDGQLVTTDRSSSITVHRDGSVVVTSDATRASGTLHDVFYDEEKDYGVNGPLYDAGLDNTEPEDAEEVATRKRLIAHASRRVVRAKDDQTLITALANQVDKECDRADRLALQLAGYQETSRAIRETQRSFRVKRVIYSDNLTLRNKELADNIARMEAELVESRNSYEATVKSQATRIADLNESSNIAQLLIVNYKANEDEEADVERRLSKRFDRERRQYDIQVEELSQRNEDLLLLLAEEKKKYERMLRENGVRSLHEMEPSPS